MSTKATIAHGENFHLYEECYDFAGENVWLQIDDVTQIEILAVGRHGTSVTLAIPRTMMREIVKGFIRDEARRGPEDGAENPDQSG
jgi:hypothetical protein